MPTQSVPALVPESTPPSSRRRRWLCAVFFLIFVIGAGIMGADYYFHTRFYPNTTINRIPVGGLTPEEVLLRLESELSTPPTQTITLTLDEARFSTSSASLNPHYPLAEEIATAFTTTHQLPLLERVQTLLTSLITPSDTTIPLRFSPEHIEAFLTRLEPSITITGATPSATLAYSNIPSSLSIFPGEPGRMLDKKATAQNLQALAAEGEFDLTPTIASTTAVLTPEQQEVARKQAQQLIGWRVLLESEYGSTTLTDTQLVALLTFPQGLHPITTEELLSTLTERYTRPPQDAVFEYDPKTLVVTTFVPDRPGLTLNKEAALSALTQSLAQIWSSAPAATDAANTNPEKIITTPLPLQITATQKPLSSTNDLGIHERIGYGESEYEHSIPSRIHNVSHTASKITNTIVKPGEEFSFNKTLGEVSRRTGFQPAYVIRNGRTELGDGGGVCQVSTTLFRSVLDAGLQVTKRLQHSYRVSYYELNAKPGIDATVYAGEVDFRFINDTDHHLLIHTQANSEDLTMYVELYGTSDGRTAEITTHEVWDARPAPPSQFIPDPSLPPGQKRQVDWAVGGVKARLINVVKDKNGKIIREDEYYSNYRPWSAKYLVGVENPTQ